MDQAEGLRKAVAMKGNGSTKRLRIFATVSGKGGVGKTNLAANMAILAARQGHRVLVIDADLGLANVEIAMGIKPERHIGDLFDGTAEIGDILAKGPAGVRVLSAGSGVQYLSQLDDGQKLRLMTAFDQVEDEFDTVIIDAGAGIGDNVLFFAGAAQEAILVVNSEPTSLTDAYATVKVLCQQAGVKNFAVVVNPVPSQKVATDVFQKLTTVTSRFLNCNVRLAGYIPRDENLHRAVMMQRPLIEAFPASPASRAMKQVVHVLLNGAPPPSVDGGMKFMWQRLFRESKALEA